MKSQGEVEKEKKIVRESQRNSREDVSVDLFSRTNGYYWYTVLV